MGLKTGLGAERLGEFFRLIFWVVALTLGLSASSFAQQIPGPTAGKGLYCAGKANFLYLSSEYPSSVQWAVGTIEDGNWISTNPANILIDNTASVTGSVGGCIFNSQIYIYVTTSDGSIYWVRADPAGAGTFSDPVKVEIGDGFPLQGVAAAVLNDTIYLFTTCCVFASKDGEYFNDERVYGPPQASAMLDAITFYPKGDEPAAIMVVYLDASSNIMSSIFNPADGSFTDPVTLPYPLDYEFLSGNLVLGTTGGPFGAAGDTSAPCIQFYGVTKAHVSNPFVSSSSEYCRWEYNLGTNTWTAFPAGQGAWNFLAVAPWFETVDETKGTMHLQHLIWKLGEDEGPNVTVNESDYMVPQNYDNTYQWDGTPTETADKTGDDAKSQDLRNLWSLVGVVLGPPPFAFNGASDASFPIILSQVTYGTDQSGSVTTTHTSTRKLSVAVDNIIKAGFADFYLDFSYAHGWISSHTATHTVEVSSTWQFGPVAESKGSQGLHGLA